MLADFVDRRGGGLLALGGRRAFAEGGYAGTAVGEALPIVIDRNLVGEDEDVVGRLTVKPTRAGAGMAVTQIAETDAKSQERWATLPPVIIVNRIGALKPGATTLLSGLDESRREQPVLAFQRYGRGKALIFTPEDSWRWQMDATIDVEDLTHENLWRQLLRWTIDGVPDYVEAHTTSDRVDPGESATLTAEVADKSFVELNDASVTAHIIRPDKTTVDVPMAWGGERAGEYTARLPTTVPGWYEARVEATRGGATLGTSVLHVRAAPGDAESFDATMHAATLRRIAEETGGRFYTAGDASALPEDLRYTGRGVTTVEEHELWHMPIVLFLLLGLLSLEWGYRRAVGLA
jgi:hypothetical protein